MQIAGLYSTASAYLEETTREKQQAKDSSAASVFSGEDTVSISQAARERYAAQAATKAEDEDGRKDNLTDEQADGIAQQASGSGGGSGVGGTEEQLEDLEKKLKELQAKLAQIAGNESLSPDEKEAQMTGIQGQIAQVASQIAELKAQMAKSSKA